MKLSDFKEELEKKYNKVEAFELVTLRRLILKIEEFKNFDFYNLEISYIEEWNPYWLLHQKNASINCFLLYKKLVEEYL